MEQEFTEFSKFRESDNHSIGLIIGLNLKIPSLTCVLLALW